MKLMTLWVALAAAPLPAVAAAGEIKAGTIEVEASSRLGFNSFDVKQTTQQPGRPDTVDKSTDVRTDFGVGALYYVTPIVGVGLDMGYERRKSTSGSFTTTDTLFTLGPRVGVDYGLVEKLHVFADADLLYATGSHQESDWTDPTATVNNDRSGFAFDLAAGGKFFPVRFLSVNLGLDYRYLSVTENQPAAVKVKTVTSGLGAFVGLSLYFGS